MNPTLWIVPDFETLSECDLTKSGARRYAQHPSTEVLCLHLHDMYGRETLWYPGLPIPGVVLSALEKGVAFVAHNSGFEQAIWEEIMVKRWGWPAVPLSQWHDTMARCAEIVIPQKLEKAVQWLRLPEEKDTEGNKLVKKLNREYAKTGVRPATPPEMLQTVYRYCASDTAAQAALHRRIGFLSEVERETWVIDQEINNRGVALDREFIQACRRVVDGASIPLAQEFKNITGYEIGQTAKVTAWVLDQGVFLPNMQKETLATLLGGSVDEDEPDDIDEAEEVHVDLPENVARALKIRQLIGSASVKKLGAMEACICSDDRAHNLLAYHAAGTGRWGGRIIQPQNFPRGTNELIQYPIDLKVDAIKTGDWREVEACMGPAVEAVVSSLRHAIVAGRGRKLIAADYAGIEARIVLALAGQHDKTALMASGADVYIDMALQIWPELGPLDLTDKAAVKAWKNAHTKERTVGKNAILGLGFRMGALKFFNRYASDQSLEFCQRVVDTYRKEWAPLVPRLWQAIEYAALECVRTGLPQEAFGCLYERKDMWLTCLLPSGRRLWYFNPKPCRKAMPWSTPENPDIRWGWTYEATKQNQRRTIDAHGGLLTENIVQALARDLLRDALKLCKAEGLPVVLTVHDEIVGEPEEWEGDHDWLEEIMLEQQPWAKALHVPIQVEGWTGDRYRK